jgi:malate dehydrogenase (oxaloacetate-decarboxylating)(NADP+)
VPPQYCLPVVLDVGTNNPALLDDPLYQGVRRNRVRGEEYMAFVDEFVAAVQSLCPKCCIQWEDVANINAVPILALSRQDLHVQRQHPGDRGCGVGRNFRGVALHTENHRPAVAVPRGRSAGTGIAERIAQAMALEGIDMNEA